MPFGKIPTTTNQLNSACTVCRRLGKPTADHHSLSQCPISAKFKALTQCPKKDRLSVLRGALMRLVKEAGETSEKEDLQGSNKQSSCSAAHLGGFRLSQRAPEVDHYPQFHLRTLTAVPSITLSVKAFGVLFTITLDSGATVSFVSRRLCKLLGVQIRPNGQLATLADPRYQVRSAGEVDFIVTETTTGKALLRVRALVMEKLAVDCYGGTTFHLDNHLVPDITASMVSAHGGLFVFNVPPHGQHPSPPPSFSAASDPFILSNPVPPKSIPTISPLQASQLEDFQEEGEVGAEDEAVMAEAGGGEVAGEGGEGGEADEGGGAVAKAALKETSQTTVSGEPILMKAAKYVLPDGTYSIPLKGTATASSVLILPPSPRIDSSQPAWDPQVCEVVAGSAIYVNHTSTPLSHPKNTHFRALPMAAAEAVQPSLPIRPKQALLVSPASPESILSQLKINTSLLTSAQQATLKEIHLTTCRLSTRTCRRASGTLPIHTGPPSHSGKRIGLPHSRSGCPISTKGAKTSSRQSVTSWSSKA